MPRMKEPSWITLNIAGRIMNKSIGLFFLIILTAWQVVIAQTKFIDVIKDDPTEIENNTVILEEGQPFYIVDRLVIEFIDEKAEIKLEVKAETMESTRKINKTVELERKVKKFTILFDFESSIIKQDQIKHLKEIITFVNLHKKRIKNIKINGYTSHSGGKLFNKKLALARANEISNVILKVINPDLIDKTAHGKCCYVSNVQLLNRRVEIQIIYHQEE
jgi:outer membrane protein OmpA-like peptidoglycan-associated protein